MKSPKIALLGVDSNFTQIICKSYPKAYNFLSINLPFTDLNKEYFAILINHDPPKYDGIYHLKKIKKQNPSLTIIMLSSSPSPNEIIEAFNYGVSDFLFLPIQPEKLKTSLERFQPNLKQFSLKSWWNNLISFFYFRKNYSLTNGFDTLQLSSATIDLDITPSTLDSYSPDLKVRFLGTFKPQIQDKDFPRFPGKKVKTLLAYILFCHPKPVHRDVLIDRFWQTSTPDSARNCLNVTLYAIRKVIEEVAPMKKVICYKDESYFINPDLIIERDIDLIEKYWKKGRTLEQTEGIDAAVSTYYKAFEFLQGDFLEDLPYEEWTEREREKYREIWLIILDRLSIHFLQNEKYDICLNLCKQMLAKDECLEEVHRRLMICYKQLGKRDKAIRQYRKCSQILKEELNVAPCAITKKIFEEIMTV